MKRPTGPKPRWRLIMPLVLILCASVYTAAHWQRLQLFFDINWLLGSAHPQ